MEAGCGCATQLFWEKKGNIIGFQFEIFPFFRIIFVVFMERNKKKTEWTQEETELLSHLYSQFSSKKWKKISEQFKQRGFNRSEIECREKWINFLDPSFSKQDWQPQQLRRLYDLHEEVGTRWCLIQKEINRTQNKIKNRFYGTLRNYIRFVLSYFDSTRTCYNYEISKLSPKFLNDLYTSQNNFSFMAGESKQAIYDMNFIVDKKLMGERVRKNRSLYSRMHQVILEAFEKKQAHPESGSEASPSRNQQILEEQAVQIQIQIKNQESIVGGYNYQPTTQSPEVAAQRQLLLQMAPFLPFPNLNPGYFYWYV